MRLRRLSGTLSGWPEMTCSSRRAGDETGVSDDSNGTKRWYAERKQRITDVVFCERTSETWRRRGNLSRPRDEVDTILYQARPDPDRKKGSKNYTLMMRTHGRTETKG